MTTYFTADQHFFHKNIIRYCDRPYANEKQMRTDIITRHNQVVRPDDEVIHVGDFAMVGTSQWEKVGAVLKHLNGTHHLVIGNHDDCKWDKYIACGFSSVHSALWFKEDGICCVHDPSNWAVVQHNFDIMVCGHIHGLFDVIRESETKKVVNVGVDVRDFKPISMNQVKEL